MLTRSPALARIDRRNGSRRAELRRGHAAELEPVRVGRYVDERAEARVRDRAVVALEEVLRDDLPVRVDRPLRTVVEDERVDVDDLRHLLGDLRERVEQ